MRTTLLDTLLRYTEANADEAGIAHAPLGGISTVAATRPSEIQYAIQQPLLALVVQGRKRVKTGDAVFDLVAGDSMIISADVPTFSQITEASIGRPYCSFVMQLDRAVLTELAMDISATPAAQGKPIHIGPTDDEVADAALRMMRLLQRPSSLPVLGPQLVRELHYWLMVGRHGAVIGHLGWPDGPTQRIGKAVAILRRDFARPFSIAVLAEAAGMSLSSFHHHFKAVTSLSPLQFQKQLRLIEARRLMLARDISSSTAAFAVGYESVNQFTREYARLFGLPPIRDISAARAHMRQIAA